MLTILRGVVVALSVSIASLIVFQTLVVTSSAIVQTDFSGPVSITASGARIWVGNINTQGFHQSLS